MSGLQQSLQNTQDKVVAPVAGLSTRMDQMSNDLHTLGNAVSDMESLLAKMQTQLTDLNNAVKVMQAPAPAPPAPSGAPVGSAALPSAPPISATDLYNGADRDRNGGHYDLALQEYSDFVKYYPVQPKRRPRSSISALSITDRGISKPRRRISTWFWKNIPPTIRGFPRQCTTRG